MLRPGIMGMRVSKVLRLTAVHEMNTPPSLPALAPTPPVQPSFAFEATVLFWNRGGVLLAGEGVETPR